MSRIQKLQDAVGEWADATFGPGEHNDRQVDHLIEELGEIKSDPSDELEFADGLILYIDLMRRNGHSITDIIEAAERKLNINKARKWERHENGLIKHVQGT